MFANAGITEKGSLLPDVTADRPMKPNLATLDVNLIGVTYCEFKFTWADLKSRFGWS